MNVLNPYPLKNKFLSFLLGIICAVSIPLGLLSCGKKTQEEQELQEKSVLAPRDDLKPSGTSVYDPRLEPGVQAVSKALPSVVSLTTESVVTVIKDPWAEVFKEFQGLYRPNPLFQQQERKTIGGFGSGVIIDALGYIVTNFHTLKDRKDLKIIVSLSNGESYPARIVAADDKNDVALLKIDSRTPLPSISVGDSDRIMLGQRVLALGNPFGLDNTVTSGIISAKSRNVKSGARQYEELIQTDAAINPGNSGGALIDLGGNLIGINVMVLAKSQGIGFALPVNRMMDVLSDIYSPERTRNMHLGLRYLSSGGHLFVRAVSPGSSAFGLVQVGDRIISVDGKVFHSIFSLQEYLVTSKKAGDRISFVINREGKDISSDVVLREFPIHPIKQRLGMEMRALTPEISHELGLGEVKGLMITGINPECPAYELGLRGGMVILALDDNPTESSEVLENLLQGKKAGEGVTLDIISSRPLQGGGFFRQSARVGLPLM